MNKSLMLFMACVGMTLHGQEKVYSQLGRIALEGEELMSQKPTTQATAKLTHSQKTEQLLLPISDLKKKQLVFDIFDHADAQQYSGIMQSYSLREINLLAASEGDKHHHLMNKFPTKTVFGSAVMARLLAEPVNNLDLITRRQQILKQCINALQDKDALYQVLLDELKTIAQHEALFLNTWNPDADLDSEIAKKIYWERFQGLNNSPATMETSRKFNIGVFSLNSVAYAFCLSLGWGAFLYKYSGGEIQSNDPLANLLYSTKQSAAITTLLYSGMIGFGWSQQYAEFKTASHIYKTIYRRMYHVAQVMRSIESIARMMKNHPQRAILDPRNALLNFVENTNISAKLQQVKELLSSSLFDKPESSIFNPLGTAVAAMNLMNEVKDEVAPLLIAIGTIDAFTSVADVFVQHTDKPHTYCFVEFAQSDKPVINITGLWNPLVNEEYVIESDIALGGENANNIILTGPNGGGKSTYMKAIAYAVDLAQSFGIVPAHKAEMTLFTSLHTYSHIKENLAAGESTFMAEKKRLDFIQRSIAGLMPEEFSFSIIDEPLKGTIESEGAVRTNIFCKAMAPLTNSIIVIATHYEQPTQLEEETDGIFVNYHPEIVEPTMGTFQRTFKVIKGANQWWFKDAARRERYINWLISIE